MASRLFIVTQALEAEVGRLTSQLHDTAGELEALRASSQHTSLGLQDAVQDIAALRVGCEVACEGL